MTAQDDAVERRVTQRPTSTHDVIEALLVEDEQFVLHQRSGEVLQLEVNGQFGKRDDAVRLVREPRCASLVATGCPKPVLT